MIEIFENIPQDVKDRTKFIFDMAIRNQKLPEMVKLLNEYTENCINEEEKEFVQFYFNLRMENLLNGSNNGKW